MDSAPIPADEEARVLALHALGMLDTPAEARFDRLTRLACRLFEVPIALVSLVDSDRQWFKSRHGLQVLETPRDISFCGHTILEDTPLVVPDAWLDLRFNDNPLVTGMPNIRFYAGWPMRREGGSAIGTFCIIDTRPRPVPIPDIRYLADFAEMASRELRASS
jgi:GAF domain-containing protein